jgi:hypothetical protein
MRIGVFYILGFICVILCFSISTLDSKAPINKNIPPSFIMRWVSNPTRKWMVTGSVETTQLPRSTFDVKDLVGAHW